MENKEDLQSKPESSLDYNTQYAGPPPPQQPPPYYPSEQIQQNQPTTIVVGQPVPTTFIAPPVSDNMCLAIFACLCCCWPLGLVAIFKADKCREALDRGDVRTAVAKSSEARTFSLIAICLGAVLTLALITFFAIRATR